VAELGNGARQPLGGQVDLFHRLGGEQLRSRPVQARPFEPVFDQRAGVGQGKGGQNVAHGHPLAEIHEFFAGDDVAEFHLSENNDLDEFLFRGLQVHQRADDLDLLAG